MLGGNAQHANVGGITIKEIFKNKFAFIKISNWNVNASFNLHLYWAWIFPRSVSVCLMILIDLDCFCLVAMCHPRLILLYLMPFLVLHLQTCAMPFAGTTISSLTRRRRPGNCYHFMAQCLLELSPVCDEFSITIFRLSRWCTII